MSSGGRQGLRSRGHVRPDPRRRLRCLVLAPRRARAAGGRPRRRGRRPPCEDDAAGLVEYTDAVIAAIGDRAGRGDLVVVGHSMGALTAPLVTERVPVALLVLVAAMTPRPGESGAEWGTNTGSEEARQRAADAGGWSVDDEEALYLHDVPADVVAASDGATSSSSRAGRSRTPGRWMPGPPCRPGSCCVATTAASRPSSSAASRASASASCPTRWPAVTSHRWPIPQELSRRLLAYAAEVVSWSSRVSRRDVAERMEEAAAVLLASLDGEQRASAAWPFPADDERRRWFYTPTDHGGLTCTPWARPSNGPRCGCCAPACRDRPTSRPRRSSAWRTCSTRSRAGRPRSSASGAGIRGCTTCGSSASRRRRGSWGWRFGGHHVSINHTVVDGELVASTPCFLGADPASSPLLGPHLLRPLAAAEDLGRELVRSLDADELRAALISPVAPVDLATANRPRVVGG